MHFKSTLRGFAKNCYFVGQGEAEEESIFSVKSFEDIQKLQYLSDYNIFNI